MSVLKRQRLIEAMSGERKLGPDSRHSFAGAEGMEAVVAANGNLGEELVLSAAL